MLLQARAANPDYYIYLRDISKVWLNNSAAFSEQLCSLNTKSVIFLLSPCLGLKDICFQENDNKIYPIVITEG